MPEPTTKTVTVNVSEQVINYEKNATQFEYSRLLLKLMRYIRSPFGSTIHKCWKNYVKDTSDRSNRPCFAEWLASQAIIYESDRNQAVGAHSRWSVKQELVTFLFGEKNRTNTLASYVSSIARAMLGDSPDYKKMCSEAVKRMGEKSNEQILMELEVKQPTVKVA